MLHLIGLLLALALFSIAPAALLFVQYNLAIAVAFFSLSLTLLSVFWHLADIKDHLKLAADRSV